MKKWNALTVKLNALVLVIVLVLSLGLASFAYQTNSERVDNIYKKNTSRAAATVAAFIDGNKVERLLYALKTKEFNEARNAALDADDDGMADAAITLLNLANLVEARDGLLDGNEQILGYLDRALALLHDPKLKHDGYYAFVCEKCAPTFGYYGYFADKQELEETARRIYEGT